MNYCAVKQEEMDEENDSESELEKEVEKQLCKNVEPKVWMLHLVFLVYTTINLLKATGKQNKGKENKGLMANKNKRSSTSKDSATKKKKVWSDII